MRAIRTPLASLVAAVLSSALLGITAVAASPHLALDPDRGPGGTTVTATGSGFCASCGPVEIDIGSTPVKQGIAVASDGSFRTSLQIPSSAPAGTDAVNAYQQGGLVTQTSFTVTPSTAAPVPPGQPAPTATPARPTASPHPVTTPSARPSPAGGSSSAGGQDGSATATASSSPRGGALPGVTATSGRGASGGLPAALVALIIAGGVALLAGAAVLVRRRLG